MSKGSDIIPISKLSLGVEEIQAAVRVLRSGILTDKNGSGPCVQRFEKAFAEYVGTKHAVAMNSGTAALHASLLVAGVGPGDEVIVPSFTFVATAEAVVLTGAQPVFVEINGETYNMDPEGVEEAISPRAKAIIPVHLYGLTADMDPIVEAAHERGIVIIEDAAQAHGATYGGRMAGGLGDLGCFSFYGSKNITTGEGGMVTTNDGEYASSLRMIRSHGEDQPYRSVMIGGNYRMPELEAAIGLCQLSKLPTFLEARKKNANILKERLGSMRELTLPSEPEGYRHAWYVFTIRVKGANAAKRNKIVEKLHERGVGAQVYYPTPIHTMPYYRKFQGRNRLRKTETAARQVISLPVHPSVSGRELDRIVNAVDVSRGKSPQPK